MRHAIEMSEAPMSTIHGLTKFEIRNCGTANDTPQTRIAGQICEHSAPSGEGPDEPKRHDQREERQLPANHRAEQKRVEAGDVRKSRDRCAERAVGDRRGVGDERQAGGGKRREAKPDQDGARHGDRRPEARRAFEERAERKGNEEKLDAAVGADTADGRLQGLEEPFSTVSRYRKITFNTIQPIGKKPVTAPSTVARNDMPAGMVKTKIATMLATISAMIAAMCAFTLFEAIRTRSVTTGNAAATVDKTALLNGS